MKTFLTKILLLGILAVSASAQTTLNFNITDGKTRQTVLQLPSSQKEMNAGGITVQQTVSPAGKNQPETYAFTITNSSHEERWLYLNWETPWSFGQDVNNLHYWSGKGTPVTGSDLLKNPSVNASMDTTMLQTVYDDKNGVALALPPDQIVSQLQQSLDSDNGMQLHLQIPLVLDAGQSDTFPIEIYHFTPRYGFLDALQQYFSAHPVAFNARIDIDPRAAGAGGGSASRTFEQKRRFGSDWDWFYAPFRRTGDIYGRQQFWDYTPARPNDAWKQKGATAQDFQKTRHQQLDDFRTMGVAPAFYTPSFLYCEIELAKEQYPDAIIKKLDGSYARLYTTPWVTSSNNEVEMYPWGNKFAQQSMDDAKQVVEENDVPAFGYDIMAGGVHFRGKGMNESPRRAFDADGEYVDTAVGIAKMADFTRSLEKDGHKTGLVGNATNDTRPFLVARSDSLMFEQPPYYYSEELTALRYAAGHKIITFWSPWRLPDLLKTEDMTPAELRAAYQGAADYTRLACYRYGAFPSERWGAGVPQIMQMLPLLKEVIQEGWQAVPAVRTAHGILPSDIWPARYGNDVGSFITLGNAEKTAWNGQVIVDNDYLGTSNYLFADVNGIPLPQTVKGRTTVLQVQIPSHETLVLRAVAAIPATANGDATVSWNNDGAKGVLNINSTFNPAKVAAPHNSWELVNNKAGKWNFNSASFNSPLQEIHNFPFFTKDQTAQIVLPPNPTTDEQWAAAHIQGYFQFWGNEVMKPAEEITLPILQDAKKVDPAKPVIMIGGNTDKIQREGQTLKIGGKNLQETTLKLLAALDQKYPYTGTLPVTGRDADAIKKGGLGWNGVDSG